tara:strand:- start:905 stop:1378 length:474 start_codon:yes stop_codon:yes gene_type:complete
MQAITDTSMVPPGGWIYLDEDGNKFRGTTLEHAVVVVREAYFASKKTPPKNLEYAIMDQICKRLESDPHSDRCFDYTPPTKTELLTRAGNAIKNFVNNGFKMVTAEQLLDRRSVCEECSLWNGEGSFGMGRCGSCGCTGLKLHVAGEKCPLNKWEEI